MTPEQLAAIEVRHRKRMDEQRDWNIPGDTRDLDIAALIAEVKRLQGELWEIEKNTAVYEYD